MTRSFQPRRQRIMPIHGDRNSLFFQFRPQQSLYFRPEPHEQGSSLPAALIGVEYLERAMFRRGLLHSFYAKKSASSVIDTRHARTRRVNQFSTAAS
jgi:hypothetical protein